MNDREKMLFEILKMFKGQDNSIKITTISDLTGLTPSLILESFQSIKRKTAGIRVLSVDGVVEEVYYHSIYKQAPLEFDDLIRRSLAITVKACVDTPGKVGCGVCNVLSNTLLRGQRKWK